MASTGERIRTLEMRVERLETWAGPGQAEVLSVNLRALRADVVTLRRVQNQHTVVLGTLSADVSRLKADVSELKADVSGLKADVSGLREVQDQHSALLATLAADVSELKAAMQEILRRIPPPSAV